MIQVLYVKLDEPGSEDKGGITECYPGLGLRVKWVRPKAESGVGMDRVHEGKAIDRGLNRITEVELWEWGFRSLLKFPKC
jgi:hypothetical protein